MSTERIEWASHVAVLDHTTGSGLLVLPHERDDMDLGAMDSLHAAEWHAVVADLDRRGWEPLADDDGLPMEDGRTKDGRTVLALYGHEPLVSHPDLIELAEARPVLWAALGS